MSKENLILDYASPQPIAVRFPTAVRRIVLLFILPALVLPFVKYGSYSGSPLDATAELFRLITHRWKGYPWGDSVYLLAMLGPIFFVGIPLVLYHLRLLIFSKLSKIEIWTGYILAILGMVLIATTLTLMACSDFGIISTTFSRGMYLVRLFRQPHVLIVFTSMIALSIFIVVFLGKRISHDTRVCACLCITYMAGLLLGCMLIEYEIVGSDPPHHFNLGFSLSLPVIAGCWIELTTLAVMAFRRRVG